MLLSKPVPNSGARGPGELVLRPLPHGRAEALGEGLLGNMALPLGVQGSCSGSVAPLSFTVSAWPGEQLLPAQWPLLEGLPATTLTFSWSRMRPRRGLETDHWFRQSSKTMVFMRTDIIWKTEAHEVTDASAQRPTSPRALMARSLPLNPEALSLDARDPGGSPARLPFCLSFHQRDQVMEETSEREGGVGHPPRDLGGEFPAGLVKNIFY